MTFNDIIDLFKQGKATARSHMRNLIEIAAADGTFTDEEQRLLEYVAMRNNISASQLRNIRAHTSTIRFEVPKSDEEKFFQLYDLVHMMSVDKDIHEEEFRLCEIIAVRFGYRKETVREIIAHISNNIKEWIGPQETMDEIKHAIKGYN